MTYVPNIVTKARSAYANRQEPEYLRPLATLYWRVILLCAVLLVVGAIAWGATQLIEGFRVVGETGGNETTPQPVLNRARLDAALGEFDSRQGRYDALKRAPYPISDPSR